MRDSKILLLSECGVSVRFVCFFNFFLNLFKANLAHDAELEMLMHIFEDQNNDRSELPEGQHC